MSTVLLIIIYLVGVFIVYCIINREYESEAKQIYTSRSEQDKYIEKLMDRPKIQGKIMLSWISLIYIIVIYLFFAILGLCRILYNIIFKK